MTAEDEIRAVVAEHGIDGPWEMLPVQGLANRAYATHDVVIRIAADHPESGSDALTESVAAPVAFEADVLTPRLLVFDATCSLIDRPYSIWERIHGVPLGTLSLAQNSLEATWGVIGAQLATLHSRVKVCADPNGYLDNAERDFDVLAVTSQMEAAGRLGPAQTHELRQIGDRLRPSVAGNTTRCFLHNDLHEMNVLCSPQGRLLAIIDWGDAGWGDPATDFSSMPLQAVPYALAGYETVAPDLLGTDVRSRIGWDRLGVWFESLLQQRVGPVLPDGLREFLRPR